MEKKLRASFNSNFNEEKYNKYIEELESIVPGALDFRNSETPIFVPADFKNKMLAACESIADIICNKDFKSKTEKAVPENLKVQNENDHTHFIAFDFGVCKAADGSLEPQLIEMQGFPTIFGWQAYHSAITATYAQVPNHYDSYLNGYNKETYIQLLKEIVIGNEDPESVVLLEIFPEQQKTRVDFYCTQILLGISIVCVTQLIKKGNQLFYEKDGKLIQIKRIYNRVIFDDVQQQTAEVQAQAQILFEDLDVQWVPHPNWFYRISKYTLPFIEHPYVPKTIFLNDLISIPTDLENYVLKPLFSFAGQGVIIDIQPGDIEKINDKQNWILQKKVQYADIIETPDEPAKVEIRVFYFWKEGWQRPIAVHNLARMSKGKMVGTRYNKDKKWVGGTVAYFEK
jgi:hypothetical protein